MLGIRFRQALTEKDGANGSRAGLELREVSGEHTMTEPHGFSTQGVWVRDNGAWAPHLQNL